MAPNVIFVLKMPICPPPDHSPPSNPGSYPTLLNVSTWVSNRPQIKLLIFLQNSLLPLSSSSRGKWQLYPFHWTYHNLGVILDSALSNLARNVFAKPVSSVFKTYKESSPSSRPPLPHFGPNHPRPQCLSNIVARVILQELFQVRLSSSKSLH